MHIGQRVAIAGMVVSGSLAFIKIFAGVTGHSTAVVADGLESAGDVFASGFVLLGLTLAARPADKNHPYGHGRAETLTGLLIGLALTAAGALISYDSLRRLGQPHMMLAAYVVWPLVASLLAKVALASVKFHYGRKLRSDALTADAEWVKHNLARAADTLPNGYCGRPPQQECPHPNACGTQSSSFAPAA